MTDRRILLALMFTRRELAWLLAACIGVAIVPVSEWLWVRFVLPRVF